MGGSLKSNLVYSYTSQAYVILANLIFLPLLVKKLGAEAYGLIGFFLMLQNWMILLDLGLSPTLMREISRYRAKQVSLGSLLRILGFVKKVFIVSAILISIFFFLASKWIAESWLKVDDLGLQNTVFCLILLGLNLSARWLTGIFKATLTGFEELKKISILNIIISTFRFGIVLIVLEVLGYTIKIYFAYQLIISIIDLLLHYKYSKEILSHQPKNIITKKDDSIKEQLKFSMTIAFTAAVWTLITQLDKLVLSKEISLMEYGYYSLAIQLSSGIQLLVGPLSSALLPRMAKMYAEENKEKLISLYRYSTRYVVILATSIVVLFVFFDFEVIYSWSGNHLLSKKVSPFLSLYSIGNWLLVVSSFPYYIQYAMGNLKYHLLSNISFLLIQVPLMLVLISYFGAMGAGYAWVFINVFYFIFWVQFIHYKFLNEIYLKWLINDVLLISLPVVITGAILKSLNLNFISQFQVLIQMSIYFTTVLVVGLSFDKNTRNRMNLYRVKFFKKS